jgi:hypothetical protein
MESIEKFWDLLQIMVAGGSIEHSDRERIRRAAQAVHDAFNEHFSELETSLENARKERDAELALRGEAEEARDYAVREAVKANAEAAQAIRDRDYWQKEAKAAADVAVIERNIRLTTERERDAALADNAELVRRGRACGPAVVWALGLDGEPHPGAALLERMKRLEEAVRAIRMVLEQELVDHRSAVRGVLMGLDH